MHQTDNHRNFSRIPAAAIVEMTPESSDKSGERIEVETLDISSGGVMFSSDRSFEIGSRWNLTLSLDKSLHLNPDWSAEAEENVESTTVKTLCEIVRVKGSEEIGYDIAVRFVDIDTGFATALRNFLIEL